MKQKQKNKIKKNYENKYQSDNEKVFEKLKTNGLIFNRQVRFWPTKEF